MSVAANFPETPRTWINRRLGGGEDELREVRRFLMEIYAEPLRRAAQQVFRLSVEAATDLVHGFFASRLAKRDYLARWESSGKRLREWLWNGLAFYRREVLRSDRRRTHAELAVEVVDEAAAAPPAELERAFVVALVRGALVRAEAACRRDGLEENWRVFFAQAKGGRLVEIAAAVGITVSQARVKLRGPKLRFVESVAELLVADGVARAELPRAIRELVELQAVDGAE